MTEELSGLKQHIDDMTSAIFGEYLFSYTLSLLSLYFSGLPHHLYTGRRVTHLGDDVWRKLKAAYTLVEQLYAGAQRAISAISHNNPAPTTIQGTLEKLSILPTRIVEVKKSCARGGSLMG